MQGMPAQTGAFIVSRRSVADNPFPVIMLIQSVKLWQKSYFYVRNVTPQMATGSTCRLSKPAHRLGGSPTGPTGSRR